MPKPSVFDEMTSDEFEAMKAEYERRRFKDIAGIVEWLSERGYEVSRSAAGRKNKLFKDESEQRRERLERRLAQVKASTMMASAIATEAGDESGKIADGLLTAVQAGLFDTLDCMDEAMETDDPETKMKFYGLAAKAVSEVARASVTTKKFNREVNDGIRKQAREEAAQELTEQLKNDGISEELEASIKRILIGK
jgi:hypothetical protein